MVSEICSCIGIYKISYLVFANDVWNCEILEMTLLSAAEIK